MYFSGRNVWRVVLFSAGYRLHLTLGASAALSVVDAPGGTIIGKVGYPLVVQLRRQRRWDGVGGGQRRTRQPDAHHRHADGQIGYALGASRAVFSRTTLACPRQQDALHLELGGQRLLSPPRNLAVDVATRTRYVVYRGKTEIRGLWFQPGRAAHRLPLTPRTRCGCGNRLGKRRK